MIASSTQRRLLRAGVCALLLALGVAGDRVNAQIGLPTYELTKEGQIWQYAGHIGAPMDAICRQDYYACPPPEASQLWEPTGFATFQSNPADINTYRLLIADRINERFSVFGWQTSLDPGTPHGQVITTISNFASTVDTDGDGFANTRLSVPESVSVDSVGNVIIADSGNSRLIVLDENYQYRFEINYGTQAQVAAYEGPFPYYLALTPGTEIQAPGACVPGSPAPGRILAGITSPFGESNANSDNPNFMNQIIVYDGAFCELSRIGTASQLGSDAAGEFKSFNGLTFDAQGRLYVSDYVNARIQVFLPTGMTNPLDPFTFTGFDPTPALIVADLAPTNVAIEPWGVMIDDRGRLVIAQPNRERISVFNLDWDGPGPVATWAFELTAEGQIQGAPHHVDRDSLGRWLISTPFDDQIDVFLTPELAVFDQVATAVDTNNDGGVDAVRVEFSVATPLGKTLRPNVRPFAEAVPAQVGDPTGLGAPTGPFPSPLPVGPGNFPDEGTDIAPGTYARWYFLFPILSPSPATATFNVWATSDAGGGPVVTAPSKTATTLLPTCASTGPTELSNVKIFDVNDPTRIAPDGPAGNKVYGPNSEIQIAATDDDDVVSIYYQFSTSLTPVDTTGGEASFSIPVGPESGSYTIYYWAIDGCNTVSPRGQIDIYVDFEPPRLAFNLVDQPSTGTDQIGRRWWNTPVTMQVDATDDDTFGTNVLFLGTNVQFPPQGPTLAFNAEGLLQTQLVSVADPVGNLYGEYSYVLGGEYVNIDMTRPTVTLAPQSSPINGWYRGDVSFLIEANDALSGVATARFTSSGSAPVVVLPLDPTRQQVRATSSLPGEGGAVTLTVGAADQAGNLAVDPVSGLVGTRATVKIDRTAPIITATPVGTVVGGVYQRSVAVTLSAADLAPAGVVGVSGFQSLYYSINGGAEQVSSGTVSLGPFTQDTTISVRAIDVAGNERATLLTYPVNTVNYPPVAVNDAVSSNGATSFTLPAASLLGNDTDGNNDPLTIVAVTQGAAGTVILNANGTVTYTRTNLTASSDVFTYTVSDGFGGTSTASVTVLLNRPPVCGTARANPPEIWPPNHKKQYNVNVIGVTDSDGNPFTITITGIFQDEPVNTTGDGQFSPDGGGVGTSTAWVRAERMGGGNGRVYEIRFTATDSNGGSCSGSVYTTVPKSRGQARHAIDDGHRYDSTVVVPGTHDKNQIHKNK